MRRNEDELLSKFAIFPTERDEDKIPKTRDGFVADGELDRKGESK